MIAAAMSELDAVNLMLSVIGEAPVNSITSTGLSEVAMARNILLEVSREAQDDDWVFNQEDNVSFPLTSDGHIELPPNVLRLEAMEGEDAPKFTIRGTKLYNKDGHSYVFSSTFLMRVTFLLEFEELPQAIRFYISIRAARKFQKRSTSSELLEKFSEDDEMSALCNAQDQDAGAGDYNLLTDSWDVARIWVR